MPPTTCLRLDALSSTPGELRVTVNGRELATFGSYGYGEPTIMFPADPYAFADIHPGTHVTVTVTPSYVTGPWMVGMIEDGSGYP